MRTYILLSFALAGCAVDLPAGEFSCESDPDCERGFSCVQSVCREGAEVRCVDDDGDGFGVEGALTDCRKCRDEGACAPDCDDDDPTVHPEAGDVCDGVDNNCSGGADEVLTCSDALDCPSEGPLLPDCNDGECIYYAPLRFEPGCDTQLTCSAGERQIPAQCI